MRILIEDKDIAVATARTFDMREAIAAGAYLVQIAADWSIACASHADLAKQAELNDTRMRNVAKQIVKGLMGPGDEATFKLDGMKCAVSILEDAGKHTGKPWMNAYEFGPLNKRESEAEKYNPGWPNDVNRPMWLGVGHSPDGEQYV